MSLDLPEDLIQIYLEALRIEFTAGKKDSLLEAIRFCGNEQVIMPEWVVGAFFAATNDWYALKVKTLDDAFGCPWPKGKHLNAAKKRRDKAPAVYLMVKKAKDSGIPVDSSLFEGIASELGINKTDAISYYSGFKKKLENPGAIKVFDILLEPYKVKY